MALFGDSEGSCPINASIPAKGVESLHQTCKYEGRKVKHGRESPIDISVQYNGDQLDDGEVEKVENYLSALLTDEIGIRYLRD